MEGYYLVAFVSILITVKYTSILLNTIISGLSKTSYGCLFVIVVYI